MAQFQSPINYVTGDQVTAANLNNHINGAVALPGLITDQSSMTANTLATGDQFFVYDLSVTALRKVNASDILGSGLAITTSAIGSPTATDLVLTPAASQKVDVAGTLEADDINVTDDLTVTGDTTLSGPVVTSSTITANGSSTFVGNVIVDNGFTSNGTANFTGVLQVNGSTAYMLYEVAEETIPKFTAINNATLYSVFTSFSYTKPSDEIWVVQFNTTIVGGGNYFHYRLTNSADTTNYVSRNAYGTPVSAAVNFNDMFVINSGTSYSGTFVLRTQNAAANVIFNPVAADYASIGWPAYQQKDSISKFVIFKYKTA